MFSSSVVVMLNIPEAGLVPSVPPMVPASVVADLRIVPTVYVAAIRMVLSADAKTIGAPHGLKYGDSICRVSATVCAEVPTVSWTLGEVATKKNGSALWQFVLQPNGN